MKCIRLISSVIFLIGFIPAGCTAKPAPAAATATLEISPTSSRQPSPSFTLTATSVPTGTPTATASPIPCDPAAGSCIETGHFFLERPIALPGVVRVDWAYAYGSSQNGKRDPHHGVDLHNPSGTPVLAAGDGKVVVAGDDSQEAFGPVTRFYGNLVVLEHQFPGIDQPVFTLYGHLSKVEVQVGQAVRAGDEIGKVGSSGVAIGSHLHFEIRLGRDDYDSERNPVLWLKPLMDENGMAAGVIAGRLTDAQGKLIHTSNLNVQFFPDPAGPQAAAYLIETYAPEKRPVLGDDRWQENFTLGDLPAGRYRLSLVWGGKLYDRWVDVQPGALTLVTFTLK